jgi:glycine oxidase
VTSPDIIVAGGGIIGLSCAYELARAGLQVEVLDRTEDRPPASLASAGLVSPLFDPPFSGPLVEAGRTSRDLWIDWAANLREESGLPVEHDTSGALILAHDDHEEAELMAIRTAALELGEGAVDLQPDEARALVPDLSPSLRRALLLPREHRVDNVQVCEALLEVLRRRRVVVRRASELVAIDRQTEGLLLTIREGSSLRSSEVPLLVVATGAWSGLLQGLPSLHVHPVHGQLLRLEDIEWPWKGQVRRAGRYAVRRGPASLIGGATLERVGFKTHPTAAGAASISEWFLETFPTIAAKPLSGLWSGIRPGTPDDLPIIGRIPGWPVLAATGHFRSGILLAPWTARVITNLATQGADTPPEAALRAFGPERFTHSTLRPDVSL